MSKKSPESENESPRSEDGSLTSVPLDFIPLNLHLPCPIYVKVSGKFVVFRSQGDLVTSKRVSDLRAKGLDVFFIPQTSLAPYLSYMETQTEDDFFSPEVDEDELLRVRNILMGYGRALESEKEIQRRTFVAMKKRGEQLAWELKKSPKLGARLLQKFTDSSLYYVNHSLNVCVYSVLIGFRIGLGVEEVKQLSVAALLHNVGNLFIPKDILYKADPLTDEEWATVHQHPKLGAALLDSFLADKEIVLAVKQHHERFDGHGYPMGLSGAEISLFARIMAVADVYDALTSHRPYQRPVSPQDAIKIMRKMEGKFDPHLLKTAVIPVAHP